MGDSVAVTTFRELGHDTCCVWNTVAVLALRNHLVLLLVTGYAEERLVLSLAGCKHSKCLTVACTALLGWCVSSVDNIFRLVSLVAALAVSRTLISGVSLVALGALRNLAMNVVAE